MISMDGLSFDPHKIETTVKSPTLKNAREVQTSLGLVGVLLGICSKFLEDNDDAH